MSKYLVHKACEVDKCKKEVKARLSRPGFLEANYLAMMKYDGCAVIVTVDFDGEVSYQSRTGERANLHHLDPHFRLIFGEVAKINDGVVLLGEAWWPGMDQFPEISGAFRRHSGDTQLQVALYDCMARFEFEQGHSPTPYKERLSRLLAAFADVEGPLPLGYPVFPAVIFDNALLLQHGCKRVAQHLVEQGGSDGLIMRDLEAGWTKGHSGNDGAIIKVKHRVSIDVRLTGLVEGKGKQAGMAGALQFNWHGKECEVGTGLSDAERKRLWDSSVINGVIFEVECLGFTPDGKPREPSFKGWRHDKLAADDE